MRTPSLFYNYVQNSLGNWELFHQIIAGLYLGMIPTEEAMISQCALSSKKLQSEINAINPNRPLGLVVSLVDPIELAPGAFLATKTVSSDDWSKIAIREGKSEKISHCLVPMVDFQAEVDPAKIIAALFLAEETIAKNMSVYVHCKAGRSRSAMFIAIYLSCFVKNTKDAFYTLAEAKTFLKQIRKQVSIEAAKLATAEIIIKEIKKYQLTQKSDVKSHTDEKSDAVTQFNRVLSSEKTKRKIRNLSSIKSLEEYAKQVNSSFKQCKRTLYIQNLLFAIEQTNGDKWFFDLFHKNGLLQMLVDAKPSYIKEDKRKEDELQRKKLHKLIIEEVIVFMSSATEYGADKLFQMMKIESSQPMLKQLPVSGDEISEITLYSSSSSISSSSSSVVSPLGVSLSSFLGSSSSSMSSDVTTSVKEKSLS